MTTGEKLLELSTLSGSQTALDHFMSITAGGGATYVLSDAFNISDALNVVKDFDGSLNELKTIKSIAQTNITITSRI